MGHRTTPALGATRLGGLLMGVLAGVLLGVLLLVGCEDEPPPAPPPAPPPPPRTQVAAPRAIATRAAFDLVVEGEGALLLYGAPAEQGGGVHALALGPEGERRSDPVRVWTVPTTAANPLAPHALEVSAASGGGRVGVAWVARHGREARVQASFGADGRFSPAEDYGPMEDPARVVRGNVALAAAPDGSIGLIHRKTRGPCAGGQGQCARLGVRRIGIDGASARGGMPLIIPDICDTPVPGYLWADGTWYYGLCSLVDGAPRTTVYAIRFEPQYAHADQVLSGCDPLGLARLGEGAALLVGRCGERGEAGVRFGEMGTERSDVSALERSVRCAEGRPTLEIRGEGGAWSLSLSEPVSGLAALLPESAAPDGSRAVWTGEALLVAAAVGNEVALGRFECEDGVFQRTDIL